MNQTALSGTPLPALPKRAKIERKENVTNSQVVYGDNNVVIWGDGNTVIQKIAPNKKPTSTRLPAPVILGRPTHPIRLLDRTEEKKSAQSSLASGAPLEFYGPAGHGKSTLLRYLSSKFDMQDGMIFLELRNNRKLEDLQQELFEAFYQSDQNYVPNEVQLKRCFEEIQALILLDDSGLGREELQSLRYMLPHCVLVTTSSEQQLWGDGSSIALSGLPEKDAVALFEQQLGRRLSTDEQPIAKRLCAILEGNPLQIIQAAASIRKQKNSLKELVQQFAFAGLEESLHSLSVSKLPQSEKNLLAILAVIGTAPLPAEHIAEILQIPELTPVVKDLLERGLIKAHSPRYSLTGSLDTYLEGEWDLSRWKESVLLHFINWSARTLSSDEVIEASDATFKVLEIAAAANRWQEVLQIGQAMEPAFILGKRWGAWARLMPLLLRAGQSLGERAIEAWALHQMGSQALCKGQFQQARELLSRALEIRKAIGDQTGITATEHNLAQLPGGVPPRNPPRTKGGPSHFNGWIIGLVVGSTILGISLLRPPFLHLPKAPPAPNPELVSIDNTAPPSDTEAPSPIPEDTAMPYSTETFTLPTTTIIVPVTGSPTITFTQNVNCRSGPGTVYDAVDSFLQGQTVQILGRNDGDPRWWLVSGPGSSYEQCWVSYVTGDTSGAADQVYVVAAPPPPTTSLAAPDGFSVSQFYSTTDCLVTLTWNDVDGEDGYRIYRDNEILDTVPADATSYDSHDDPYTYNPHTFYVEAYNASETANSIEQDTPPYCGGTSGYDTVKP